MNIYEETQRFYESVTTKKRIVGKSLFGRDIYAVKIGDGSPVGIAQYAIHGREFITAKLAFEQYAVGVKKGSCWLLPLVNPDGALLAQLGLASVEAYKDKQRLLSLNNNSEDFSLWKSNGRGVDLNVNFDACWGKGVQNVLKAGSENYIGAFPFSETETQALRDFTEEIRPNYTISYHTKGEEIYYGFECSMRTCPRDFMFASLLENVTGYTAKIAKGSVGGYKDWCILRFGIPAFTIEVGSDTAKHPLGEKELEDIIKRNRLAIFSLSGEM